MTLDYKLALSLKEAGFPFKEHLVVGDGINTEDALEEHDPTLSELIEACGEKFASLLKCGISEWRAYGGTKDVLYLAGSTPEQAVAALWISMNKKPTQ